MDVWEYRIVYCQDIEVKDQKGKRRIFGAWIGDQAVEGVQAVFEAYGATGWELVNGQSLLNILGSNNSILYTIGYFKRRK